MNATIRLRQEGSAAIVALVVFTTIVAVLVVFFIARHHPKTATPSKTTITTASSSTRQQPSPQTQNNSTPTVGETATQSLARNSRNVSRRNDAASLLNGAAEFSNNNVGQWPTAYSNGQLISDAEGSYPANVSLQFYKDVAIAQGAQNGVTADRLQLTVGAACDTSGGTVVSPRRAAAQYGLENADGSFKAACTDM